MINADVSEVASNLEGYLTRTPKLKKHRFERKLLAERGCDTDKQPQPRTKRCSILFAQFLVPAKFKYAARKSRLRPLADW